MIGYLPDCVTFSPDGRYVVTACEWEPSDDYTTDPKGTVYIIDTKPLRDGTGSATSTEITFSDSDLSGEVRITSPSGTSTAEDLEPEYIAIDEDSVYAYVSFQENNAIGKIALADGTVQYIQALGYKDHSQEGYGLDASGKDDKINITTWPVMGMYMPDSPPIPPTTEEPTSSPPMKVTAGIMVLTKTKVKLAMLP